MSTCPSGLEMTPNHRGKFMGIRLVFYNNDTMYTRKHVSGFVLFSQE